MLELETTLKFMTFLTIFSIPEKTNRLWYLIAVSTLDTPAEICKKNRNQDVLWQNLLSLMEHVSCFQSWLFH